MSTLLLDASAILAAFDSDDVLHEPARAVLVDPELTLATLDLARYEVTNGRSAHGAHPIVSHHYWMP